MKSEQPLAFVCHDLADIAKYAVVENQQYRLLAPAPPRSHTFILDATREVPKLLLLKRKQVGIRVPDHPVVSAITAALGRPIISTTAGHHGEDAFVDSREIDDAFPGLALVLDAGGGGIVPTTVVDITGGKVEVVREGAAIPISSAALRSTDQRSARIVFASRGMPSALHAPYQHTSLPCRWTTSRSEGMSMARSFSASSALKGCGSSGSTIASGARSMISSLVTRGYRVSRPAMSDRGPDAEIGGERIATLAIGEHVLRAREIERVGDERVAVDGHQRLHPDGQNTRMGWISTRSARCASSAR